MRDMKHFCLILVEGGLHAFHLKQTTNSYTRAYKQRRFSAVEGREDLLHHATELPPPDAEQVLEDYATLLTLARPEVVPLPDAHDVAQTRSLIRYTDVPVLLSAMQSRLNRGGVSLCLAYPHRMICLEPCTYVQYSQSRFPSYPSPRCYA